MKSILDNSYLNLVLRLFLGCFFIAAGVAKIADPLHFSNEIIKYNVAPLFSINLVALVLPWLEVVSGILLAFGIKMKANSFLISLMLLLFITLVMSAIFRGLNISCGCFGKASKQTTGWTKVFENIGLLAISIYLYFSNPQKLKW